MEGGVGRFQVSDPGRRGCRRHHWVIDHVEIGGETRERWTCSVCDRVQWRDPLAPKLAKRERFSRWSTLTTEDLWEIERGSESP